jgi:hypothetical protein
MKMRIIFKSGAIVDVDVTEFTIGESKLNHVLTSLEWRWDSYMTTVLKFIRLDEIVAILRVDEGDGTDGIIDDQRSSDIIDDKWGKRAEAAGSAESTPALETRSEEVDGG